MRSLRGGKVNRAVIKAARAADIPADAAGKITEIILNGCHEVRIEGHKGLAAYEENVIAVNCRGFLALIKGGGLEMTGMNEAAIVISGDILEITVER